MEVVIDHSQRVARGFGDELRQLARLGGPIAVVQFGQTALNLVDCAFLGHYDAAALSAMSLGNTLCWAGMVFCMGVLTAVDPLLSQALGARDHAAVSRVLGRGFVLAMVLVLPVVAVLAPADHWLRLLGQKDELIAPATTYARINLLGLLPFFWFTLLRSLLSAHSRTGRQLVAILLANALNALLDWMLIFGRLGAPELGVAGAAWATVLCRWAMFAILLGLCWGDLRPHLAALRDPVVRAAVFAWRPIARLLRLGAPIGAQFALEMGVFAASALCIGQLDAQAGAGEAGGPRLGGHQVALQFASASFMLPLGLGMAASVRIGWAVGRGDQASARRSAAAALLAGVAVMGSFMVLFLGAPGAVAGLITDDAAVLAWAVLLLPIAGVFQIGDGLQVVSIGCLRGLGDVRSPLWSNVVGFWLVGLPLGLWLAMPWGQGLGPVGLWWGLVAGLFAVAVALLCMLRLRLGEVRGRLRVD